MARIALAIELHECGLAMMRQRLAREAGPGAEAEADRRFRRWLLREDDPIPGDVAGPVRIRYRAP